MKISIAVLLSLLCLAETSRAQTQGESDDALCAQSISSMGAILGQLKNNPSVRSEQISAAIDGHTPDAALRRFIRTEIAPRILSQDKKIVDAYLSSKVLQARCVEALHSYAGPNGD